MASTGVLLTSRHDVLDAARVVALHRDDRGGPADAADASGPVRYHVLVPAGTRRNLLVDVLDHLSLLELRQALDVIRGSDDSHGGTQDTRDARVAAAEALWTRPRRHRASDEGRACGERRSRARGRGGRHPIDV
ncbi:MAG: hypothetical protein ACRCZP_07340 [Phycicoccus sp.]